MEISKWVTRRDTILELFVIFNLSFLSIDIYIAHSVNQFHHWAEWIPFIFSIGAPTILVITMVIKIKGISKQSDFAIGNIVGTLSIIIGIAGMIYHLKSQFFESMTIKSLVYTAPFVAPLSYAGLGFLLILNRMVDFKSIDWARWLIFFALGGFVGNFILSLCDHAQNGFFSHYEWVPVISSAFAVGFLIISITNKATHPFLNLCLWILGLQIIVGLSGFAFHLGAIVNGSSSKFFDNLLYGAPIFAPLLFLNLSLLGGFGIIDLKSKQ